MACGMLLLLEVELLLMLLAIDELLLLLETLLLLILIVGHKLALTLLDKRADALAAARVAQ